jgi:hypothetical protein
MRTAYSAEIKSCKYVKKYEFTGAQRYFKEYLLLPKAWMFEKVVFYR